MNESYTRRTNTTFTDIVKVTDLICLTLNLVKHNSLHKRCLKLLLYGSIYESIIFHRYDCSVKNLFKKLVLLKCYSLIGTNL